MRSPAPTTRSRAASHPTVSSFGEIRPTWSTPSWRHNAMSSSCDWNSELRLLTEIRGWGDISRDLRLDLLDHPLRVVEIGIDRPHGRNRHRAHRHALPREQPELIDDLLRAHARAHLRIVDD